jgi:hypothetical protein
MVFSPAAEKDKNDLTLPVNLAITGFMLNVSISIAEAFLPSIYVPSVPTPQICVVVGFVSQLGSLFQ